MGLSASQAQLLSITARISNNELRSQFITNAKLRLAEDSNAAATDYMKALDSTNMVYSYYNADGAKSYEKLTPGLVMTYAPLKNQYGIINSDNQILVTTIDDINYSETNTLYDFLDRYDLIDLKEREVENPAYIEALKNMHGGNYTKWIDDENINKWLEHVDTETAPWFEQAGTYDPLTNKFIPRQMTPEEWAEWTKFPWENGMISKSNNYGGQFELWIDALKDIPEALPPYPDSNSSEFYDTVLVEIPGTSLEDFMHTVSCMSYVKNGQRCYMHVLSDILGFDKPHTTSSGTTFEIEHDSSWNWNSANTSHDGERENFAKIRTALENQTDSNGVSIYQKVVDFLWDNHFYYNGSATGGTASAEELANFYVLMDEMEEAFGKEYGTGSEPTYREEKEFNEERFKEAEDKYNEAVLLWQQWYANTEQTRNYYEESLNLPDKTIMEEYGEINDPTKAEWYTNLWYRMGGLDDGESLAETHRRLDSNMYKVIADDLLNNSAWLQYALENGLVSIEQVLFEQKGSALYPNLEDRDWKSTMYTSVSDFSRREDSLAITKAEAKYNQAMNEITAQDKKYDQDLKKLDTEHNALQTQFESVKGVIDKNIERSFKAFS